MTSDHEPVGQVGCIDGRILNVSRHSDVVHLAIGKTETLRSAEAAAILARLLTSVPAQTTASSLAQPASEHDRQALAGLAL